MGLQADEPAFAAALQLVQGREALYLRLMRLTRSAPDYVPAAQFVRQCLAELRGLLGSDEAARVDRFFERAGARLPLARLLPVLAAEHHAACGHRERARSHAAHALCVNQDDLHAQKLERQHRAVRPPEPDLHGRFCANPFDKLETHERGEVYFCCPAWLPTPIGNLNRQSAQEIWNSAAAQDIRRSILDGSYRYCSRMHCPKLSAGTLPQSHELNDPRHRAMARARRTRLDQGPRRLVLNHDRSCNLACPTCRTHVIAAHKKQQAEMNRFAERVILPLLNDAASVHITARGDPFGSAHFRHVIKQIAARRTAWPRLRLDLQTNGLLLQQSWAELGLEGLVGTVYVSIDAARAPTYAIVRRGGDFKRLLQNLDFLAGLRRAGRVGRVRLDFVVQALNFREMPEAVELVHRFGFDGIKFQMIRSWNTFAPDEFRRHNVAAAEHPEAAAFRAILRDPRLQASWVEIWGLDDPALTSGDAPEPLTAVPPQEMMR